MFKVRLPRRTCVSVTMSVFTCLLCCYPAQCLTKSSDKVDTCSYYRVQFNSIGNSKASLSCLKLLRLFKQFSNYAWPITANQFKLEIREAPFIFQLFMKKLSFCDQLNEKLERQCLTLNEKLGCTCSAMGKLGCLCSIINEKLGFLCLTLSEKLNTISFGQHLTNWIHL